jgi:hypothetical protein
MTSCAMVLVVHPVPFMIFRRWRGIFLSGSRMAGVGVLSA